MRILNLKFLFVKGKLNKSHICTQNFSFKIFSTAYKKIHTQGFAFPILLS